MEVLNALIDRLNKEYSGPAREPTPENTALLQEADLAAGAVGHLVCLGVDDVWYSLDAKKYLYGKTPGYVEEDPPVLTN